MSQKDNVDLICGIAELGGLFEKSRSLDDFLQSVVSMVAWHMKAAVCSIYVFEEATQELVLRASQGLSPDAIGRVRLKLGEGITGLAVKELRPICEGRGKRHPAFKLIPGIQEERYEAFLAVPILRGIQRIGSLVVQDPQPNYFDDTDIKALKAIAAQLASVVESADLLLRAGHREAERAAAKDVEDGVLQGRASSSGVAYGKAIVLGSAAAAVPAAPPVDIERFRVALLRTEQQLERLQAEMEEKQFDIASLIFSAHLLILKDSAFSGAMIEEVEGGLDTAEAVVRIVNRYVQILGGSPNPRLREKVQDVQDVGHRILHNMAEDCWETADYRGHVVVAGDLRPSDIVRFAAQRAEGIVLAGGGVTAHVSILAKSLDIPMILVDEPRVLQLPENTPLLVDADTGILLIRPRNEALESYGGRLAKGKPHVAAADAEAETLTADGIRVRLLANVNLLSDLAVVAAVGAEGVGLYRTEFPFIVRNDFPSEEAQYRIYRAVLDGMAGKEVVFRTLDVGGDKMLSYFPNVNESNPFLGMRAIRFSLRYRPIFNQQLRALLRAGDGARLRIMFPLVSSVDDFVQARGAVQECLGELARERAAHNARPELGVMVELPSAVEVVDELAAEADFLCIGTNDLIQYMLAVDRTNQQISEMYRGHHPAVLRALKRVVDAALRAGRDVSLCGEMAADEKLLPFLLGIGIRTLSVDARSLPNVRAAVRRLTVAAGERLAGEMLARGRISEVEALLSAAGEAGGVPAVAAGLV